MKPIVLISFLVTCTAVVFAQNLSLNPGKPPVDTGNFTKWLSVKTTWDDARSAISNDGNYILYRIREDWRLPATFIIRATNGDWKMELPDVQNAVFTEDSRKAIYINSKDSLCLLALGSSSINYIPHVGRFTLFMHGKEEWLAYGLNIPGKELIVHSLATRKEQSFAGVNEYLLSQDGHILILDTESKKDSVVTQSLSWVNLSAGSRQVIWEGAHAGNLVLNAGGTQLAFVTEDKIDERTGKSFWYYKAGTEKAVQLADNHSAGIDKGLQLDGIAAFSKDGGRLFIRLIEEKDEAKPKPGAVKVDVWSYTDPKLQSEQLRETGPESYAAVLSINDHRILRLQQENDRVVGAGSDDFLCMINRRGNESDGYWNTAARGAFCLVSSDNGERKQPKMKFSEECSFSPDGRWLAGLDETRKDWYSYEFAAGIARNLTKSIPVPVLTMAERDILDHPSDMNSRGFWLITWSEDGNALINDGFDIWKIDPAGENGPVNLTNGYGREKKIVFSLAGMYAGKTVAGDGQLILNAFDKTNKNSGFYRIRMGKKEDPELLTMGPYVYDPGYNGSFQIKARDAAIYMVMRESATQSPNYFLTKDFKNFTSLSEVYTEKNYNWVRPELLSFTTLDGRTEQAILYKPENFDPKKKYPVIIHYYERKSQDMNTYNSPGNGEGGHLDIPWFVSHGYIVFAPDIHYKMGEIGQSAYNSIVAARKFISRYPWVDAKHIGLQGYSFGGYETNYVVAHSSLFAAAVSTSGLSDLISEYGTELRGGNQSFVEADQMRMGASLWKNLGAYLKNSPIFQADKVTTPILIIANKKDENVSFAQGLEWFLALRRLGKKAWMLQYDEESHGIGGNGKNYKDYVMRMNQFFEHYLRGALAPVWMTRGIPAKMKGIDDGLELDYEIKTPGPGLLRDEPEKNQ